MAEAGVSGHVLPGKFQRFRDHWLKLRDGGRMTTLSDFLDHPVPDLQPWVCILDVDEHEILPTRLLGTGLVHFYGVDITGKNFLDAIPASMRPRYLRLCHEMVRNVCGMFHKAFSSSSRGREIELTTMSLPLQRTNGRFCTAWLVDITETLQFNEMCVGVERIVFEHWIDLGHGTPQ